MAAAAGGRRAAFAAGCAALLAVAPAAAGAESIDELQGTWRLVRLVFDGQESPAADTADRTRVVEGERSHVRIGARDRGTQRLVPAGSGSPFPLDLVGEGPLEGLVHRAVYRVEGSTLTLCYRGPGKDRPTELVSTPGSGVFLETYERVP